MQWRRNISENGMTEVILNHEKENLRLFSLKNLDLKAWAFRSQVLCSRTVFIQLTLEVVRNIVGIYFVSLAFRTCLNYKHHLSFIFYNKMKNRFPVEDFFNYQLFLIYSSSKSDHLLLTSIWSCFGKTMKNNTEEERWRWTHPQSALYHPAQQPHIPAEHRNAFSLPWNIFTER